MCLRERRRFLAKSNGWRRMGCMEISNDGTKLALYDGNERFVS